MSGPISYPAGVGGIVHFQYSAPGAAAAHEIHLAVLPFASSPSGGNNDYLYTNAGPITSTEDGLLATFAGLGAVWAPYYPPIWELRLVRVYRCTAGYPILLPIVPTATPIPGSASADEPVDAVVQRTHSMFGATGRRWRTWLRQMPGTTVGQLVNVGTTTGGLDSRDRAWFSYISGDDTGIIAADGTRYQPGGRVRQWWDKPLTTGLDAPYLVTG